MDEIVHFLLIFDRGKSQLLSAEPFHDPELAAERYADAEQHFAHENVEVVLVGADSIETLKQTHGHYFGEHQEDPSEFLALAYS